MAWSPRRLGLFALIGLLSLAAAGRPVAARTQGAREGNEGGDFDWDFGQVYADRDLPVRLDLTNGCKFDQDVTIRYPKTLDFQPDRSPIGVGAYSTLPVYMALSFTKHPRPPPPYPPGFDPSIYDYVLKDTLETVHPKYGPIFTQIGDGIDKYTCAGATKTYHIRMHVHQHGPPDPPPPDAGRKKSTPAPGPGPRPQPAPNSTCALYWNFREFYPNVVYPNPESCLEEIRALAIPFFGALLDPIRTKNPAAWNWVPTPAQIDQMTVSQLMDDKAKADAQARSK